MLVVEHPFGPAVVDHKTIKRPSLRFIFAMAGAAAAGEGDAIGAEGAAGDGEGAELAAFFAGLIGGGGEVVGRCHVRYGCGAGGGGIQVFCGGGEARISRRGTNWGELGGGTRGSWWPPGGGARFGRLVSTLALTGGRFHRERISPWRICRPFVHRSGQSSGWIRESGVGAALCPRSPNSQLNPAALRPGWVAASNRIICVHRR